MAKRSHTWLPFLLESSQIYCMQAVGNAASPIIKQGGTYHGSESAFCIKDQYHSLQFLTVAISQE